MKNVKRIACLLLCTIIGLTLLAGCGGGDTGTPDQPQTQQQQQQPAASNSPGTTPSTAIPSANPAPAGAEFVEDLVILGGDKIPLIDTGNPAFNIPQSAWICNMVFNNLVKLTVDAEYVPALATSWETTDMQHFTFYLRDDVYFHNGEKFTADDVAFTIDRAKDSPGSMSISRYIGVESYEIVSDTEIKINLANVNVDFIDDVATPQACILNRKAVEADPEEGPRIGTGPWIVTELVTNDYVLMVRNENYWGELPPTKTINIRFVEELSARLIMLENGEAHIAYQLSVTDIPIVQANPDLTTYDFILNNTAYVGFNMLDPLMSDINFRLAVAHAISRDDCVTITRNGYAVPVSGGTYWGYRTEFKNNDIPIFPYDLDKAREYLAMTNYNGETIEIVAAMADPIKNAQIIQANLAEIGLNCTVYETDTPGLNSYAAWGNTDVQIIVYSGAWTLKAVASRTYYYPATPGNRTNYENPAVTELYDRAAVTVNDAERENIYREIQEITAADIPYIGIFNMQFIISCAKGLDGMLLYPTSNHDFSYIYMVKD